MIYTPHPYQDFATEHIINNESAGLFLEMGLGKTVAALTAIDRLINDYFEVSRVLVIAPLRVADETWAAEVEKWDHLKHLRIAKVLGPAAKRIDALRSPADVYIINRENVPWLVGHYGTAWPFDMVVIDELSSFKAPGALRFKALKQVRPLMRRVVGLTGTPAPNSLVDLWPQVYLLDEGQRLGRFVTRFRQEYFSPGRTNGQIVFDYKPHADSERRIYEKISDICISMKAEDYLQLPARIDRRVNVVLPDKLKTMYDDFERAQVLELMSGDIDAVNAAALTGKLLQFANGAVYDNDGAAQELHHEKLTALEEILDTANGAPVLVFYAYKHDRARIHRHLKAYTPHELKTSDDIRAWNEGRISLLLAHPASAGHGLNLQAGGHIVVWFGLTWSLELYQQANARLHRQGQTKPVIVHHLIGKGTIDEDVMAALESKADRQEALMQAVKARIAKYKEATK